MSSTGWLTRKQGWVLGLTALASFMISLDSLVVSTALPTIRQDLQASFGSLIWIVNAYNLTFAVLLLTGAALGDRFGRRRIFVGGLLLFTLASAACALSPNAGGLIAARAIQGVGAAMVMPLALAQLSAAFPPQQRGKALGIFMGVTGLATFLGPFAGGVLAEKLTWEWIFWINIPLGLIAILFTLKRIEESRGPNNRFDLRGVLLVTAGAFGLVWGLQRGNIVGWSSLEVIASLVLGAILVAAFISWQRHAAAPLLPLRFFRIKAFTSANAVSFFLFAQIYGMNFMLAQFLQNAQGYGPLAAGIRMMPLTATVLVLAPLAGAMADRIGERMLVVVGLTLQAIGVGIAAFIVTADIGYWELIIPLVIGSCGVTLAIPATQKAVVGAVKPPEIGQASGTVSTLRYFGGVFGIALLGAVFSFAGSHQSPQAFTEGFAPTLGVIAAFAVLGVIVGLGMPGKNKTQAASAQQSTEAMVLQGQSKN